MKSTLEQYWGKKSKHVIKLTSREEKRGTDTPHPLQNKATKLEIPGHSL